MISNLEMHVRSGRMAARVELADGSACVRVYEPKSGKVEVIGEIDPWYLPQQPNFSPDGSKIAFFGDGSLYFYDVERRTVHRVFADLNLDASFCVWSPFGDALVFSAHPLRDGTHPPDIFTLSLQNGDVVQVTNGEAVDRFPLWSPSGREIVFHRQYLNESGMPKHVQLVDVMTGKVEDISPRKGASYELGRRCWSPDSTWLAGLEYDSGTVRVVVIQIGDRSVVGAVEGNDLLSAAFFPNSTRIVVIHEKELEIFSIPDSTSCARIQLPNGVRVIQTMTGPAIVPDDTDEAFYFAGTDSTIYRGTAQEGCIPLIQEKSGCLHPEFNHEHYNYRSKDGRSIPAHRLIPPNPKRLAVVFVFGGPREHIALTDPILLRLVSEGYEVICPAYRGCKGYGPEHEDAHIGEYGRADVWDVIVCAQDWRARTEHRRPMAVVGYSYGGFLTLLALAAEDASWACGVSLWGVTGIEKLRMHVPRAYPTETVQKDIAMVERSATERSRYIRSPLLILHGARDTTATTEEVQLIQQRVLASGGSCELVVYEDDGHGLKRHRQEIFGKMLNFLAGHER
ncbi:MAG: S9 family peptidase [Bacilli bacterium]